MRVCTSALVSALAAAMVVSATARPALAASARTVPCQEIIDHPTFPYVGHRDPRYRFRLVLGMISAPPAFLGQAVALHERPWPYWLKAPLVIRAGGPPVSISVPERWKHRVAILWGNGNYDAASSIRIAGCGTDPAVGNAYAGGFFLRFRAACAPLVFRVGHRSATVRFGIGRRCR
jgi:hypothetical protein